MIRNRVAASFGDASVVETGPAGQRAHRDQFAHAERLERGLHEVAAGVWCLVGNGLSNQTFIEGPEGLIVIDTGESVEEMAAALLEVRRHTSAPVAAVVYSHFHYCGGTRAVLDEAGGDVPVWAHEGVSANLARIGAEVAPMARRGMVHQFHLLLPDEGPDASVHVGLGLGFRMPEHAPHTPGHVPPTHTVAEPTSTTLAGLRVDLVPAPSDADDNLTIFLPDLGVCVNNLAWPALFNVFAIRGEPYRDPQVLVAGLDGILGFRPEHLVGAHGPPLSGATGIAEVVTDARDALQFIWDQTVRGLNRGLTDGELVEAVRLPAVFDRSHLTQQHYGLAEHHVRQVRSGLVGWFDGDEARLFPLPPAERCARLVEGFGGRSEVARRVREALDGDDLRWALELASWLVRSELDEDGRADGGSPEDRELLASVLRTVAHRTTSANVRGWCLTRARDLEGSADVARHRVHRFGRRQVMAGSPVVSVHALRVLLDPDAATGVDVHLRWRFTDGPSTGLWVRNHVAVPTDGSGAAAELALSHEALADLLSARNTFSEAVASGAVVVSGDGSAARRVLACFDLASLSS